VRWIPGAEEATIGGRAVPLTDVLMGRDRPTALFVSNDLGAIALQEFIDLHGLRVPEDVSIVGFDNVSLSGPGADLADHRRAAARRARAARRAAPGRPHRGRQRPPARDDGSRGARRPGLDGTIVVGPGELRGDGGALYGLLVYKLAQAL
jgi:Periplasmic binding protein-like domain